MNELLGTLRSFGPARLAIILGVTIGAALAMGLVIARIGAPSLGILYADLDYAEAQDVLDRLQQDGVDHQIRESGGRITVLAPRDDMAKLRLALAADGVVAGRTVGYEIFDQTDAFGATTFQQNINRLRALEGELA
ncbi:MAG: flagellar M-ring protein FliF, partial [Pseudomonadota bacterium]